MRRGGKRRRRQQAIWRMEGWWGGLDCFWWRPPLPTWTTTRAARRTRSPSPPKPSRLTPNPQMHTYTHTPHTARTQGTSIRVLFAVGRGFDSIVCRPPSSSSKRQQAAGGSGSGSKRVDRGTGDTQQQTGWPTHVRSTPTPTPSPSPCQLTDPTHTHAPPPPLNTHINNRLRRRAGRHCHHQRVPAEEDAGRAVAEALVRDERLLPHLLQGAWLIQGVGERRRKKRRGGGLSVGLVSPSAIQIHLQLTPSPSSQTTPQSPPNDSRRR